MNTEQLINSLEMLKGRLPRTENDNSFFGIQDKIKEYEDKIANPSNYYTNDAAKSNALLRVWFDNQKAAMERNESLIAQKNIELNYNLDTAKEIRREIADPMNDNMSIEESNKRVATAELLENDAKNIEVEIAEAQAAYDEANGYFNDEKYSFAKFEELTQNDPSLDIIAYFDDQKELDDLKEQYEKELSNYSYTQSGMVNKIDTWIEGLRNGSLTIEQVNEELTNEAHNLIANSDIETDRENELAEIDRELADTGMELTALQKKLGDRANYYLTELKASRYDSINGPIAQAKKTFDMISGAKEDKEIQDLLTELTNNPDRRDEIMEELRAKRARYAENQIKYKDEIAKTSERITELEQYRNSSLTEDVIAHLEELTDKINNAPDDVEARKEYDSILSKIGVDTAEIRLDERRLVELISANQALKNRREYLEVGIPEMMLTLASGVSLNQEASSVSVDENTADDWNYDAHYENGVETVEPKTENISEPIADKETADEWNYDAHRENGVETVEQNDNMRGEWLDNLEKNGVYWGSSKGNEAETVEPIKEITEPEVETQKEGIKDKAINSAKKLVTSFVVAPKALKAKAKEMLAKFKEQYHEYRESAHKLISDVVEELAGEEPVSSPSYEQVDVEESAITAEPEISEEPVKDESIPEVTEPIQPVDDIVEELTNELEKDKGIEIPEEPANVSEVIEDITPEETKDENTVNVSDIFDSMKDQETLTYHPDEESIENESSKEVSEVVPEPANISEVIEDITPDDKKVPERSLDEILSSLAGQEPAVSPEEHTRRAR